jgi:hypothetical protein
VYSLFKFTSKDRRILHVAQTPNIYNLQSREWWPLVDFIKVEHFTNPVDLMTAKFAVEDRNASLELKTPNNEKPNRNFDLIPGGTSDGE